MNIKRAAPVNELLARLIFLILPTAVIGYFLLVNINHYYSILQDQAIQQSIYLAAGMAVAAIFYSFRFRFLVPFIILLAVMYSIYKGLDKYAVGEFDAFFIARQFQVFAILFTTGWIMGWGFTRLRYWSIFISASLLTACIALIAKANTTSIYSLLSSFTPALLYAIYIIFTSEQIYNYKDRSQRFWWFLARRLTLFTILAALILGGVVYVMRGQIKETVANYGGGGKPGKNSMLKENKDGTFDITQYSRLGSSLSRSRELLFCARIDNFFPGTDIPNPLYLTAFYFTKFDTLTETFERDSTIPYNDLFMPDPSKIPLFYTKTDTSVIHNSLGEKLRTTVEIEVYLRKLSPKTYLAPNVGYFVQPIAVEKEFRGEFTSAFRAKSYVSVLNSAYFVYNTQNKDLRKFQEQRFEVLRKVTDYSSVDPKFMKYYTYMPGGDKYRPISALARTITDTATTPVDKVLAIRNYFYSKDENGDRLYTYTDNPGIPDLPNASKLMYFLNESHKGYCAYFAGAALFMLRSLGIPSRIAVGFLTEDRSDKNKGWYWYYANQAHAWIQVYFPGYGWLDFDPTAGNDNENRPTPQPDGTPPMQPPRAWLAADGIVDEIDTIKKTMRMSVKQFVFHDKEFKLQTPALVNMDMKVAVVYRDSTAVKLAAVHKGDEGTAVSYAEAMKLLEPRPGENGAELLKRFPELTPVDEVYLKQKETTTPPAKPKTEATKKQANPGELIMLALSISGALLILLLSLPRLVLGYFILRYRNASAATSKPYWAYMAASYYLHMCGIVRGKLTPMQYARQIVDPRLGTTFTGFMNIYLKKKYAKQALTATEQKYVDDFLKPFLGAARKGIARSARFFGFLNPVRTIGFFMMPEEEGKEA